MTNKSHDRNSKEEKGKALAKSGGLLRGNRSQNVQASIEESIQIQEEVSRIQSSNEDGEKDTLVYTSGSDNNNQMAEALSVLFA